MKIILAACNAKYIHSNLAVYDLKAYAGKYQDMVEIREYTMNQQEDEILRDLYLAHPDVVCFSCYIWNISFVNQVMADLKQVLPGVDLWTGGPEVSYDARQYLETHPQVLGVMKGEGEETFLELAGYYAGGSVLEDIRGLVYSKGDEIIETLWREPIDLSSVPFVYKNLEGFANKILYYETSRGCPFSCSYCLSSVDKRLRFRDLSLVREELQFFLDNRVPQVKFVDRTFNCRPSHARAVWSYLLENDNGVTNFHFEIAADLLQEEDLELISRMRPGLIQLEIGVQSTNPPTLDAIRRQMDFARVSCIVSQIAGYGNAHQHLDLIAGLPYEDYQSFAKSFNQVYALRPQQLQLGFLKVLKGSPMGKEAEGYGCLYKKTAPYEVLATRWLPYEKILKLKQVESMVEVYYNSAQFQTTLPILEREFSAPFAFYESLGGYYEEQGYDTLSHSRMRRYEILLGFAAARLALDQEFLKAAMTYDLYARENLKSRPQWMAGQRRYAAGIREYFREQKIPRTSHIEAFTSGEFVEYMGWESGTVLFDYSSRDPLNNNACTAEVHL